MTVEFPTRSERPGSQPHIASLEQRGLWPEFLYHDPILDQFFGRVMAEYAEFQFYAWDDEREEVVAVGMSVPVAWDGNPASLPDGGLDAVVAERFAESAPEPTALSAMQILIAPEYRGQALSARMIERMREIGRENGLETLIAPVRPTLKQRYPLTPMERYIGWRRADGAHFDPWLRTHERLGAEIVKVAPHSTTIPGSIAEWEDWAEMAFPETGSYVVPGAFVPVEIDRERDEGVYREPNVWMVHPSG